MLIQGSGGGSFSILCANWQHVASWWLTTLPTAWSGKGNTDPLQSHLLSFLHLSAAQCHAKIHTLHLHDTNKINISPFQAENYVRDDKTVQLSTEMRLQLL